MASACWISIRARRVSRPGSPGPAPTMATSPGRKVCSASWNSPRHFLLGSSSWRASLQVVDRDFDSGGGHSARCAFHHADFLVGEVAAGVFFPEVAGYVVGPHPGVAVTDVEVFAVCAAALHRARMLAEALHQRVGGFRPDLRERGLPHV